MSALHGQKHSKASIILYVLICLSSSESTGSCINSPATARSCYLAKVYGGGEYRLCRHRLHSYTHITTDLCPAVISSIFNAQSSRPPPTPMSEQTSALTGWDNHLNLSLVAKQKVVCKHAADILKEETVDWSDKPVNNLFPDVTSSYCVASELLPSQVVVAWNVKNKQRSIIRCRDTSTFGL